MIPVINLQREQYTLNVREKGLLTTLNVKLSVYKLVDCYGLSEEGTSVIEL